jgi:hypothetical protein
LSGGGPYEATLRARNYTERNLGLCALLPMPSGRQLGILRWRHAINHPPAWLTTIFIWDRCRASSSALGIRGCRSRFAATPLRERSDHCRCGRRRDGFLGYATKTDPLCQRRTPFRIGRRGDWVISWQLPPDAIPRGFNRDQRWYLPSSVQSRLHGVSG